VARDVFATTASSTTASVATCAASPSSIVMASMVFVGISSSA
jgi:hypothetical protein